MTGREGQDKRIKIKGNGRGHEAELRERQKTK
jgi:hypothetical protein